TPAATTSGTELSSGPAEQAPAESSLSIKRGIVTAAGDHAMFRACDDTVDLWLIDDADGTLTQLLTEDETTLYVETYGERGPVPDGLQAARGQAGAFFLEQLLYAGSVSEGRGCEQPAPDFVVTARGNEPFWAVKVTDTSMIWRQPQEPQETVFTDLKSEDAEGTVSYTASAQGRTLKLLVDLQPCRDTMSGEFFAFTSRAELDGKEFKGCARVGKQGDR
ncbi:MAG TPA: hypothetical protein VKB34_07400, partial [Povalibacter sp.]|nr:hypothetical protein [Povalibacter sp.]